MALNSLKRSEFEEVLKKGFSLREGFVVLKFLPPKTKDKDKIEESRFGIIVSLKVSKKAVLRNKVKRRIRAIIREKVKEIKPGYKVIINALPGIENITFWEIKELIEKILKKSNLL